MMLLDRRRIWCRLVLRLMLMPLFRYLTLMFSYWCHADARLFRSAIMFTRLRWCAFAFFDYFYMPCCRLLLRYYWLLRYSYMAMFSPMPRLLIFRLSLITHIWRYISPYTYYLLTADATIWCSFFFLFFFAIYAIIYWLLVAILLDVAAMLLCWCRRAIRYSRHAAIIIIRSLRLWWYAAAFSTAFSFFLFSRLPLLIDIFAALLHYAADSLPPIHTVSPFFTFRPYFRCRHIFRYFADMLILYIDWYFALDAICLFPLPMRWFYFSFSRLPRFTLFFSTYVLFTIIWYCWCCFWRCLIFWYCHYYSEILMLFPRHYYAAAYYVYAASTLFSFAFHAIILFFFRLLDYWCALSGYAYLCPRAIPSFSCYAPCGVDIRCSMPYCRSLICSFFIFRARSACFAMFYSVAQSACSAARCFFPAWAPSFMPMLIIYSSILLLMFALISASFARVCFALFTMPLYALTRRLRCSAVPMLFSLMFTCCWGAAYAWYHYAMLISRCAPAMRYAISISTLCCYRSCYYACCFFFFLPYFCYAIVCWYYICSTPVFSFMPRAIIYALFASADAIRLCFTYMAFHATLIRYYDIIFAYFHYIWCHIDAAHAMLPYVFHVPSPSEPLPRSPIFLRYYSDIFTLCLWCRQDARCHAMPRVSLKMLDAAAPLRYLRFVHWCAARLLRATICDMISPWWRGDAMRCHVARCAHGATLTRLIVISLWCAACLFAALRCCYADAPMRRDDAPRRHAPSRYFVDTARCCWCFCAYYFAFFAMFIADAPALCWRARRLCCSAMLIFAADTPFLLCLLFFPPASPMPLAYA